jgi:hypothetical protein
MLHGLEGMSAAQRHEEAHCEKQAAESNAGKVMVIFSCSVRSRSLPYLSAFMATYEAPANALLPG